MTPAALLSSLGSKVQELEEKSQGMDKLRQSRALIIDLSGKEVVALEGSKVLGKVSLETAAAFANPFLDASGVSPESEERFVTEISTFLGRCQGDWDSRIVGLPRHQVITKRISLPAPDKKMLADILRYEIEKHLPFKEEKAWYDFQVMGKREGNIYDLLITAIKEETANYYQSLFERAGLLPTLYDATFNSAINFFPVPEREAIILSLNGKRLDIGIRYQGRYLASRTVPLPSDPSSSAFVANEVNKTLFNYNHLFHDSEEAVEIYLSGTEAGGEVFRRELEEATGWGTRVIPPFWKSERWSLPREGLLFSPEEHWWAFGLLLRGTALPLKGINLLPSSVRPPRKKTGSFITLGLLTLLLLMIPLLFLGGYFKEKRESEGLNSVLRETKEKARSVEEVYLQMESLKNRVKGFEKIKATSFSKLDILLELSRILPDDAWIKEIDVEERKIEVRGYAKGASPLIKIMEESPLFKEVKFDGRITSEGGRDKFKITAHLE